MNRNQPPNGRFDTSLQTNTATPCGNGNTIGAMMIEVLDRDNGADRFDACDIITGG